MEAKEAKKKTAKASSKTEKSPKIEKVVEYVGKDYSAVLTKIFYSLFVANIILAMIFVAVLVKGTNVFTTNDNTQVEPSSQETAGDYDVSMFDELTTTDAINRISDGSKQVVYIGRSTCGYCVKFLPMLQQAQTEYGYKTIYIDLEKMTTDDQNALTALDNSEGYIKENYGYTPLVLIFENGKLSKGWVGYSEYNEFAAFLEENGFKK